MVDKRFEQPNRTLTQSYINLINHIDIMIKEIDDEIDAHKKGVGTEGTEKQLEIIKREIGKMKFILNSREFNPSYPRIIVDSWDYNSELANKLLDIAEKYRKVTR
ncbi:MAG: hypothetical protein PHD60_06135 [Clostridia bacterium]|nr:hypothetical protein [Clostridia bacterium]